jgi:exonuclease III
MDMRFGTWNVRSLYRAGSLRAAARELAGYKLGVVGVQEVRWDKGGHSTLNIIYFIAGTHGK